MEKSFASQPEDQKILSSLHPVTILLHLPLPRPTPGVTAVRKTGQGNAFWGLALGREQASTRKEGVNGIMKLVGTGYSRAEMGA